MSEGDVMIVTMIVVGGQLSIQHLRGPPLLAVLPPWALAPKRTNTAPLFTPPILPAH